MEDQINQLKIELDSSKDKFVTLSEKLSTR